MRMNYLRLRSNVQSGKNDTDYIALEGIWRTSQSLGRFGTLASLSVGFSLDADEILFDRSLGPNGLCSERLRNVFDWATDFKRRSWRNYEGMGRLSEKRSVEWQHWPQLG